MLQRSFFKSRPDPVTLGGVWGGKPEIVENVKIEVSLSYEWVIGSYWNLIYRKILCLRCSIFNSNRIQGHWGLEVGNRNPGNWKSWKTLRVERSGWNLMGRISTSSRYVNLSRILCKILLYKIYCIKYVKMFFLILKDISCSEIKYFFRLYQCDDRDFSQLHEYLIRKQNSKFSPLSSSNSQGIDFYSSFSALL